MRFLGCVACLLSLIATHYPEPQEKDRREKIHEIVSSAGNPFEYIPLRLEDAFDPGWWDRIGGGNIGTSARVLGLNMSDEG